MYQNSDNFDGNASANARGDRDGEQSAASSAAAAASHKQRSASSLIDGVDETIATIRTDLSLVGKAFGVSGLNVSSLSAMGSDANIISRGSVKGGGGASADTTISFHNFCNSTTAASKKAGKMRHSAPAAASVANGVFDAAAPTDDEGDDAKHLRVAESITTLHSNVNKALAVSRRLVDEAVHFIQPPTTAAATEPRRQLDASEEDASSVSAPPPLLPFSDPALDAYTAGRPPIHHSLPYAMFRKFDPAQPSLPIRRRARPKVLIADNNLIHLIASKIVFDKHFEVVDVCTDGQQVLQLMQANVYDIIFLGAEIGPELDGPETAEAIRIVEDTSGAAFRCLLIGMLTKDQSVDEDVMDRCFISGMDRFILKPLAHHVSLVQSTIASATVSEGFRRAILEKQWFSNRGHLLAILKGSEEDSERSKRIADLMDEPELLAEAAVTSLIDEKDDREKVEGLLARQRHEELRRMNATILKMQDIISDLNHEVSVLDSENKALKAIQSGEQLLEMQNRIHELENQLTEARLDAAAAKEKARFREQDIRYLLDSGAKNERHVQAAVKHAKRHRRRLERQENVNMGLLDALSGQSWYNYYGNLHIRDAEPLKMSVPKFATDVTASWFRDQLSKLMVVVQNNGAEMLSHTYAARNDLVRRANLIIEQSAHRNKMATMTSMFVGGGGRMGGANHNSLSLSPALGTSANSVEVSPTITSLGMPPPTAQENTPQQHQQQLQARATTMRDEQLLSGIVVSNMTLLTREGDEVIQKLMREVESCVANILIREHFLFEAIESDDPKTIREEIGMIRGFINEQRRKRLANTVCTQTEVFDWSADVLTTSEMQKRIANGADVFDYKLPYGQKGKASPLYTMAASSPSSNSKRANKKANKNQTNNNNSMRTKNATHPSNVGVLSTITSAGSQLHIANPAPLRGLIVDTIPATGKLFATHLTKGHLRKRWAKVKRAVEGKKLTSEHMLPSGVVDEEEEETIKGLKAAAKEEEEQRQKAYYSETSSYFGLHDPNDPLLQETKSFAAAAFLAGAGGVSREGKVKSKLLTGDGVVIDDDDLSSDTCSESVIEDIIAENISSSAASCSSPSTTSSSRSSSASAARAETNSKGREGSSVSRLSLQGEVGDGDANAEDAKSKERGSKDLTQADVQVGGSNETEAETPAIAAADQKPTEEVTDDAVNAAPTKRKSSAAGTMKRRSTNKLDEAMKNSAADDNASLLAEDDAATEPKTVDEWRVAKAKRRERRRNLKEAKQKRHAFRLTLLSQSDILNAITTHLLPMAQTEKYVHREERVRRFFRCFDKIAVAEKKRKAEVAEAVVAVFTETIKAMQLVDSITLAGLGKGVVGTSSSSPQAVYASSSSLTPPASLLEAFESNLVDAYNKKLVNDELMKLHSTAQQQQQQQPQLHAGGGGGNDAMGTSLSSLPLVSVGFTTNNNTDNGGDAAVKADEGGASTTTAAAQQPAILSSLSSFAMPKSANPAASVSSSNLKAIGSSKMLLTSGALSSSPPPPPTQKQLRVLHQQLQEALDNGQVTLETAETLSDVEAHLNAHILPPNALKLPTPQTVAAASTNLQNIGGGANNNASGVPMMEDIFYPTSNTAASNPPEGGNNNANMAAAAAVPPSSPTTSATAAQQQQQPYKITRKRIAAAVEALMGDGTAAASLATLSTVIMPLVQKSVEKASLVTKALLATAVDEHRQIEQLHQQQAAQQQARAAAAADGTSTPMSATLSAGGGGGGGGGFFLTETAGITGGGGNSANVSKSGNSPLRGHSNNKLGGGGKTPLLKKGGDGQPLSFSTESNSAFSLTNTLLERPSAEVMVRQALDNAVRERAIFEKRLETLLGQQQHVEENTNTAAATPPQDAVAKTSKAATNEEIISHIADSIDATCGDGDGGACSSKDGPLSSSPSSSSSSIFDVAAHKAIAALLKAAVKRRETMKRESELMKRATQQRNGTHNNTANGTEEGLLVGGGGFDAADNSGDALSLATAAMSEDHRPMITLSMDEVKAMLKMKKKKSSVTDPTTLDDDNGDVGIVGDYVPLSTIAHMFQVVPSSIRILSSEGSSDPARTTTTSDGISNAATALPTTAAGSADQVQIPITTVMLEALMRRTVGSSSSAEGGGAGGYAITSVPADSYSNNTVNSNTANNTAAHSLSAVGFRSRLSFSRGAGGGAVKRSASIAASMASVGNDTSSVTNMATAAQQRRKSSTTTISEQSSAPRPAEIVVTDALMMHLENTLGHVLSAPMGDKGKSTSAQAKSERGNKNLHSKEEEAAEAEEGKKRARRLLHTVLCTQHDILQTYAKEDAALEKHHRLEALRAAEPNTLINLDGVLMKEGAVGPATVEVASVGGAKGNTARKSYSVPNYASASSAAAADGTTTNVDPALLDVSSARLYYKQQLADGSCELLEIVIPPPRLPDLVEGVSKDAKGRTVVNGIVIPSKNGSKGKQQLQQAPTPSKSAAKGGLLSVAAPAASSSAFLPTSASVVSRKRVKERGTCTSDDNPFAIGGVPLGNAAGYEAFDLVTKAQRMRRRVLLNQRFRTDAPKGMLAWQARRHALLKEFIELCKERQADLLLSTTDADGGGDDDHTAADVSRSSQSSSFFTREHLSIALHIAFAQHQAQQELEAMSTAFVPRDMQRAFLTAPMIHTFQSGESCEELLGTVGCVDMAREAVIAMGDIPAEMTMLSSGGVTSAVTSNLTSPLTSALSAHDGPSSPTTNNGSNNKLAYEPHLFKNKAPLDLLYSTFLAPPSNTNTSNGGTALLPKAASAPNASSLHTAQINYGNALECRKLPIGAFIADSSSSGGTAAGDDPRGLYNDEGVSFIVSLAEKKAQKEAAKKAKRDAKEAAELAAALATIAEMNLAKTSAGENSLDSTLNSTGLPSQFSALLPPSSSSSVQASPKSLPIMLGQDLTIGVSLIPLLRTINACSINPRAAISAIVGAKYPSHHIPYPTSGEVDGLLVAASRLWRWLCALGQLALEPPTMSLTPFQSRQVHMAVAAAAKNPLLPNGGEGEGSVQTNALADDDDSSSSSSLSDADGGEGGGGGAVMKRRKGWFHSQHGIRPGTPDTQVPISSSSSSTRPQKKSKNATTASSNGADSLLNTTTNNASQQQAATIPTAKTRLVPSYEYVTIPPQSMIVHELTVAEVKQFTLPASPATANNNNNNASSASSAAPSPPPMTLSTLTIRHNIALYLASLYPGVSPAAIIYYNTGGRNPFHSHQDVMVAVGPGAGPSVPGGAMDLGSAAESELNSTRRTAKGGVANAPLPPAPTAAYLASYYTSESFSEMQRRRRFGCSMDGDGGDGGFEGEGPSLKNVFLASHFMNPPASSSASSQNANNASAASPSQPSPPHSPTTNSPPTGRRAMAGVKRAGGPAPTSNAANKTGGKNATPPPAPTNSAAAAAVMMADDPDRLCFTETTGIFIRIPIQDREHFLARVLWQADVVRSRHERLLLQCVNEKRGLHPEAASWISKSVRIALGHTRAVVTCFSRAQKLFYHDSGFGGLLGGVGFSYYFHPESAVAQKKKRDRIEEKLAVAPADARALYLKRRKREEQQQRAAKTKLLEDIGVPNTATAMEFDFGGAHPHYLMLDGEGPLIASAMERRNGGDDNDADENHDETIFDEADDGDYDDADARRQRKKNKEKALQAREKKKRQQRRKSSRVDGRADYSDDTTSHSDDDDDSFLNSTSDDDDDESFDTTDGRRRRNTVRKVSIMQRPVAKSNALSNTYASGSKQQQGLNNNNLDRRRATTTSTTTFGASTVFSGFGAANSNSNRASNNSDGGITRAEMIAARLAQDEGRQPFPPALDDNRNDGDAQQQQVYETKRSRNAVETHLRRVQAQQAARLAMVTSRSVPVGVLSPAAATAAVTSPTPFAVQQTNGNYFAQAKVSQKQPHQHQQHLRRPTGKLVGFLPPGAAFGASALDGEPPLDQREVQQIERRIAAAAQQPKEQQQKLQRLKQHVESATSSAGAGEEDIGEGSTTKYSSNAVHYSEEHKRQQRLNALRKNSKGGLLFIEPNNAGNDDDKMKRGGGDDGGNDEHEGSSRNLLNRATASASSENLYRDYLRQAVLAKQQQQSNTNNTTSADSTTAPPTNNAAPQERGSVVLIRNNSNADSGSSRFIIGGDPSDDRGNTNNVGGSGSGGGGGSVTGHLVRGRALLGSFSGPSSSSPHHYSSPHSPLTNGNNTNAAVIGLSIDGNNHFPSLDQHQSPRSPRGAAAGGAKSSSPHSPFFNNAASNKLNGPLLPSSASLLSPFQPIVMLSGVSIFGKHSSSSSPSPNKNANSSDATNKNKNGRSGDSASPSHSPYRSGGGGSLSPFALKQIELKKKQEQQQQGPSLLPHRRPLFGRPNMTSTAAMSSSPTLLLNYYQNNTHPNSNLHTAADQLEGEEQQHMMVGGNSNDVNALLARRMSAENASYEESADTYRIDKAAAAGDGSSRAAQTYASRVVHTLLLEKSARAPTAAMPSASSLISASDLHDTSSLSATAEAGRSLHASNKAHFNRLKPLHQRSGGEEGGVSGGENEEDDEKDAFGSPDDASTSKKQPSVSIEPTVKRVAVVGETVVVHDPNNSKTTGANDAGDISDGGGPAGRRLSVQRTRRRGTISPPASPNQSEGAGFFALGNNAPDTHAHTDADNKKKKKGKEDTASTSTSGFGSMRPAKNVMKAAATSSTHRSSNTEGNTNNLTTTGLSSNAAQSAPPPPPHVIIPTRPADLPVLLRNQQALERHQQQGGSVSGGLQQHANANTSNSNTVSPNPTLRVGRSSAVAAQQQANKLLLQPTPASAAMPSLSSAATSASSSSLFVTSTRTRLVPSAIPSSSSITPVGGGRLSDGGVGGSDKSNDDRRLLEPATQSARGLKPGEESTVLASMALLKKDYEKKERAASNTNNNAAGEVKKRDSTPSIIANSPYNAPLSSTPQPPASVVTSPRVSTIEGLPPLREKEKSDKNDNAATTPTAASTPLRSSQHQQLLSSSSSNVFVVPLPPIGGSGGGGVKPPTPPPQPHQTSTTVAPPSPPPTTRFQAFVRNQQQKDTPANTSAAAPNTTTMPSTALSAAVLTLEGVEMAQSVALGAPTIQGNTAENNQSPSGVFVPSLSVAPAPPQQHQPSSSSSATVHRVAANAVSPPSFHGQGVGGGLLARAGTRPRRNSNLPPSLAFHRDKQ